MHILTKKLVKYLEKEQSNFKFDQNHYKSIRKILNQDVLSSWDIDALANDKEIKQTLLLNFNYTNITTQYINDLGADRFKQIDIHGNLNNPESIVFGYGDEVDRSYNKIEDINDNRFFEHIKSFKYLANSNYQDLIQFIAKEPFEILVMGHSLGISDRTLLTHIFHSDNLQHVKLYYHNKSDGTNDFRDKTYEISRHFSDKADMRMKIIPFDKSEELPQRKEEN